VWVLGDVLRRNRLTKRNPKKEKARWIREVTKTMEPWELLEVPPLPLSRVEKEKESPDAGSQA